MTKIKIDVGRVKAGLASKGLTNEEAAEMVGITQSRFRRILSDGQCSSICLGRIARVLGMQALELVDV